MPQTTCEAKWMHQNTKLLIRIDLYKYLSDKLLEKVVEIADESLEEYNTQENKLNCIENH